MEREKFVLYVRADATDTNNIRFFGYDVIHFNMIEINESIMKNCVMNPDGTNNATIISDGNVVLNDKSLYFIGKWCTFGIFIDAFGNPYVLDTDTAVAMRDELGYDFKYCILHKKSAGRAEYIGRTSILKAIDIINIGELNSDERQNIKEVWFNYNIDRIPNEFTGTKDVMELIHLVNAKHMAVVAEGLSNYNRVKCNLGLKSAQDSFKSIEIYNRYRDIANSLINTYKMYRVISELSTELFNSDFYNLELMTPEEFLTHRAIGGKSVKLSRINNAPCDLFIREHGLAFYGFRKSENANNRSGVNRYSIYFNKPVCKFRILADGREIAYEVRINAVDESHMGAVVLIAHDKNGCLQLNVSREYTKEIDGDTALIEQLADLFPDTFDRFAPVKYDLTDVVDPIYKLNIKGLNYRNTNRPDFERSRYLGLSAEEASVLLDAIVNKRLMKGSKHWEVLENTVAGTINIIMLNRYDFYKVHSNFNEGKTARGYDKSEINGYEMKIEIYKDGVLYRSEYTIDINIDTIANKINRRDIKLPRWYSLMSRENINNFNNGKDIILDREFWTDNYFNNYTSEGLVLPIKYYDFLIAKMEYTTGIWYLLISGSNYTLKCKMASTFAYNSNSNIINYKLCAFKSREDVTEFLKRLHIKFREYTSFELEELLKLKDEVYYQNCAICAVDFSKIEIDRESKCIEFMDIMMAAFKREPVREKLYKFIGGKDIEIISD